MDKNKKNPFEVEHIWANVFDYHSDEFDHEYDFKQARNKLGGLILLPKDINQSYGPRKYEDKLPKYFSQNILARSLNIQCYDSNPSFLSYIRNSGLNFKPYSSFTKGDLIERQQLYYSLCNEIWNVDAFDVIAYE